MYILYIPFPDGFNSRARYSITSDISVPSIDRESSSVCNLRMIMIILILHFHIRLLLITLGLCFVKDLFRLGAHCYHLQLVIVLQKKISRYSVENTYKRSPLVEVTFKWKCPLVD